MICSPVQANIEDQRQLFHDASHALGKNQISKFNRLLKQLDGYPAQAYLEYDAFRRNVTRKKPAQVDLFPAALRRLPVCLPCAWSLARYPGTARRLGTLSCSILTIAANTRLQCISFQARLKLGRLEGLNEDIGKIWLRGYSQPPQCDTPFAYYLKSHENPEEVIWARIDKAFKARRPGLALYLGKKLDAQSRATVETWYRAHKRPEQSLKKLSEAKDSERTRRHYRPRDRSTRAQGQSEGARSLEPDRRPVRV